MITVYSCHNAATQALLWEHTAPTTFLPPLGYHLAVKGLGEGTVVSVSLMVNPDTGEQEHSILVQLEA